MNDTKPATSARTHARPHIPRAKVWLFGALFFFIAISMYAGTMYRIKHYGYVGLGADQPITPDAKLSN